MGYPERMWPHQAQMLSPVYTSVAKYDRSHAAKEWSRSHHQPSPEASGAIHSKRRDASRPRSTLKGVLEREAQLPWQPSSYPHKEQKLDDVIVTPQTGTLSRQPFHHWSNEQQSNDVIITGEMRPRTSSWQRYAYESKNTPSADVNSTSWQRFGYENRNNPVDVNMTSSSVTTGRDQSPWQQLAVHQVKDQASADVIMTSYRERSQSTGSWRSFGANRAHSGSSLVSWNGAEDLPPTSGTGQRSEALPAATYRELVNLWASSRADQRKWDSDRTHGLAEVPQSPFEEARRRFSEASQRQHLKSRLQQARQRYDDLPIDMTCRKIKTKMISAAGSEHSVSAPAMLSTLSSQVSPVSSEMSPRSSDSTLSSEMSSGSSMLRTLSSKMSPDMSLQNPSSDQRSEPDLEETGDHTSILRSMLTERGRCYSMSVLELRRRRLQASRVGSAWPDDADRSGTERTRLASISTGTSSTFGASDKQLVTLAKKNLLPVTARITDLLGRIADFARSLPEFLRLSLTDQEAVLTSACLRLLVLYMAETNLQFATTVISADIRTSSPPSEGPTVNGEGLSVTKTDQKPREPTVQFVGCLQNFVRKCQALNVTGEEYFQMKLITLFHSGVGSPDCVRSSGRINSVARQDLQECVLRNHPSERLRYSTLLLSLHTLFGIHCDMLRSLFCQHLNKTGGLQAFITDALVAELGDKKEVK